MSAVALALLVMSGVRAADRSAATPVGLWRTFSDTDGHESGQVEIVERDGMLVGRVTGIADPLKRDAVCQKCSDNRRGEKVLGLEIIRQMKHDGTRWDGGEILDPETGDTYRCSMRLEADGKVLVVRGFIGLAMFGRSQRWLRLE